MALTTDLNLPTGDAWVEAVVGAEDGIISNTGSTNIQLRVGGTSVPPTENTGHPVPQGGDESSSWSFSIRNGESLFVRSVGDAGAAVITLDG